MTDETQTPVQAAPEAPKGKAFNFRTPTEKAIKDALEDGLPAPIKRTAVVLNLPEVTADAIVDLLASGSARATEFFVELATEAIEKAVRAQFDKQPAHLEIDVSLLDLNAVTLEAVANAPKPTRVSNAIDKETWDAFQADYIEVMVAATGKTVEVVTNAAKIFANELRSVRDSRAKLETLKGYLGAWFGASTKGNEFLEIYERLTKKLDDYLTSERDSLVI